MGVTLANKIILGFKCTIYNTSFVYCIVCSPPQVKSHSIAIYSLPLFTFFFLPPLSLW